VLQLDPVLEVDRSDEPPCGDGEDALVEGHKQDDIPPGWARHGLLPGHLPLHGVGEWRELPSFDKVV
jgi:hypothetical protein